MTSTPLIAGVELGGTKCVVLLGTGPDDIRAQQRIPTRDPETTLGEIETVLRGWTYDALGIASFGPLSLNREAPNFGAMSSTTKPGWTGADILHRLQRVGGKPAAIQTDVAGAALAEAQWGAAQGLRSHAYITIGTGVGVGLISGGVPVQGIAHGEAGHMHVRRAPGDSFPGWCRFHGDCVEGLISGPALAERFGCPGDQLPDDGPQWDLFVHDLCGLLHNLVVTAAPERIAIGGGVVTSRPQLFPRIRARLAESLGGYGDLASYTDEQVERVGAPGLGAMAGPLGAIAVGLGALA